MMIYQQSATDCGDACFKMICHDHDVSAYGDNKNKLLSMLDIKERATSLNLAPQVYQAKAECLKGLQLPLIVHWRHQHFVVLYKISRGKFYIKDPAFGRMVLSRRQFESSYSDIVMSFNALFHLPRSANFITAQESNLALVGQWFREVNVFVLMLTLLSCFIMFFLLFMLAINVDVDLGLESRAQSRVILMLLMMSSLNLVTNLNRYFVKQVNQKFSHKLFLLLAKTTRTNFLLESDLELFDQLGGVLFSIVMGALMLLICLSISTIDLRLFSALCSMIAFWLLIFFKYDRGIQYYRYMTQMLTDLIVNRSDENPVMLFEHRSRIRSELYRLQLQHDLWVKVLHLGLMGLIVFLLVIKPPDAAPAWLSMAFLFCLRHVCFSAMEYIFSGISGWCLLAKNLGRYN